MFKALGILFMVGTMTLIGLAVWRTLQRQESGDETLKRKLDGDDERARGGREDAAKFSASLRDKKQADQ